MKLYSYWRSTSAWRVRIGLALKGVVYEYVPVHLARGAGEQHGAAYQQVNPLEQVPVLEIDEAGRVHRISQSIAILEYLEERVPEPPLLPRDSFLRARSRQLAEMVNSGIQPLQNRRVLQKVKHELSGDAEAWARDFITRGLSALQTVAAETASRFLVGDTVTLADLYLVPQLFNARRFGVPLDGFGLLTDIEGRCNEIPAFAAAHPDRQPDAEPQQS